MPELQYCSLSQYERAVNNETFSRLIFDDRTEVQFSDAPTDPFNQTGWKVAAFALLEAEQEVEDILSSRYEVPFEVLPEHVRGRVLRIAVYKLYLRSQNMAVPEGVAEQRDRAKAWLDEVADGKYALNLEETSGDAGAISTGSLNDSEFEDL